MIFLDTSIWIEFLKGNEPFYNRVNELIDSGSVITAEPVFGELLQGALNSREKNSILKFWQYTPKIEDPALFIKAGELSYKEKLVSKGIRLIDASIIYVILEYGFQLWTHDKKILRFLSSEYIYKNDADE